MVPHQSPNYAPPPRVLHHHLPPQPRVPPPSHQPSLNVVYDPASGQYLEYRHLLKTSSKQVWENGCSKEFARLCQGRSKDDTAGTDTITWIDPNELPSNKRPTYIRACANYRPQKADPFRVRCTLGGNVIDYPGPKSAPTASIPLVKILLNSVLSTPNAKFHTIDIKDFYLSTKLDDPEYVAVPLSLFPPDIIKDYNLLPKVKNNTVYGKVTKGMYGLPQAGRLAHDDLVKHLAAGGYFPAKHTPGLFQNKSQSVQFTLIVDNFGVKYTNVAALHHLIAHLCKKYSITHEPGTIYSGIHLKWDYVIRTCELSIPGYVFKALLRFKHDLPKRPQHSPYP